MGIGCVWWLQVGKPHWPKRTLKRVSFVWIYEIKSFSKDQNRSDVWMIFGISVNLIFKEIYEKSQFESSLWIESYLWIVNYCYLRPILCKVITCWCLYSYTKCRIKQILSGSINYIVFFYEFWRHNQLKLEKVGPTLSSFIMSIPATLCYVYRKQFQCLYIVLTCFVNH